MEEPESECAEEESEGHEFRGVEYEDAFDEEEEGDPADEEFRHRITEEYREREDAIRTIAVDILEILDGENEGVGDEQKENEGFRKRLQLIGSNEKKSREEYEDARASGREGGEEGESFQSEGRDGIQPGNRLIGSEEKEYLE